jgi:hypothetical protein
MSWRAGSRMKRTEENGGAEILALTDTSSLFLFPNPSGPSLSGKKEIDRISAL